MGEEISYRNGFLYDKGCTGQREGFGQLEKLRSLSGPLKWEQVGKLTGSQVSGDGLGLQLEGRAGEGKKSCTRHGG